MSIPSKQHRAIVRGVGESGTRLALEYGRSIYEAVDRRMPEAGALTSWLAQSAATFGLSDAAIPGDEVGQNRRRGIAARDWQKIGAALVSVGAGLSHDPSAPADRWIAAIVQKL